jgi:hypothetical protein
VSNWTDIEYWRNLRPAEQPTWPERDPEPEVRNTDPQKFLFDAPATPKAVKDLKAFAEACGWEVRIGYSRGSVRAQKIGTYTRKHCYGLWAFHPSTRMRFTAEYLSNVDVVKLAWTWRITTWKQGEFRRFTLANLTDLRQYIEVLGDVGLPWYKAIEAREADKLDRARVSAKNRATKREGAN